MSLHGTRELKKEVTLALSKVGKAELGKHPEYLKSQFVDEDGKAITRGKKTTGGVFGDDYNSDADSAMLELQEELDDIDLQF